MIKGIMYLTFDPNEAYSLGSNINTKIISLDEDNQAQELNPMVNHNVIMGTLLLPNTEILWAEIDGDEYKFKGLYFDLLSLPVVQDFIFTLIGYLFNGGNIVFYIPKDLKDSNSINFLYDFFWKAYGLHISTGPQDNFVFDPKCIPMYINGIYMLGIIDPYDFLMMYPKDIVIDQNTIMKLCLDMNPYVDNNDYKEKVLFIENIRKEMLSKDIPIKKICPIKNVVQNYNSF